ncbi:MAG: 5-formyltetrahydrofolate cyclo-ligase [Chloroflexi bacterium]|nr:5-formyltetrahydrofolate cyclo-ligase [Chloroflexota bacterium]|tara:strand:- start:27700 stop:28290 length:591 start_codon:yes stop_codon:yes gene_type:complete
MKTTLFQQKQILRKKALRVRNAISKIDQKKYSEKILKLLLSMPVLQSSSSIHTYVSKDSEVMTHQLIYTLLERNINVICPRIQKHNELGHSTISSFNDFKKNKLGILEPKEELPSFSINDLDVIIVPGLAFTRTGNRIGYGGGFYDRFLIKTNAISIGLAFDKQVINKLPHNKDDSILDYIVTEKEIIKTEKIYEL